MAPSPLCRYTPGAVGQTIGATDVGAKRWGPATPPAACSTAGGRDGWRSSGAGLGLAMAALIVHIGGRAKSSQPAGAAQQRTVVLPSAPMTSHIGGTGMPACPSTREIVMSEPTKPARRLRKANRNAVAQAAEAAQASAARPDPALVTPGAPSPQSPRLEEPTKPRRNKVPLAPRLTL
jgi:hypothetical protein